MAACSVSQLDQQHGRKPWRLPPVQRPLRRSRHFPTVRDHPTGFCRLESRDQGISQDENDDGKNR